METRVAKLFTRWSGRTGEPGPPDPSPDPGAPWRARDRAARRYLAYRRARIDEQTDPRVGEALSLLPFLLHVNRPGLPGYVDDPGCPAGIADYAPSAAVLALARRLFPEARVRRAGVLRPAVDVVAVMGSAGTVGFTRGSDLDVWVCHAPLARAGLAVYREKVRAVEAWANDHAGVEVHLFLQATERIRDDDFGETDVEGCGSAMGSLLKEEFYRTAVHLAGKLPAWWVLPPDLSPDEYRAAVASCRRDVGVDADGYVDLGGVARVPLGELFGAAIWQIVKGWKSPFKAALKMGMLERAVRGARRDEPPLCEAVKRAVFEGDRPDPYCVLFDAVTAHYRDAGEHDTVDLLARCFYLKSGARVTPEAARHPGDGPDREAVMARYVDRWGWTDRDLEHLNAFGAWRFEFVEALAKELDRYFLSTYQRIRQVLERTGETQRITDRDLTVLGRRLQAVYRRTLHKVETVHLASAGAEEAALSLYQEVSPDGDAPWGLYRGRVSPSGAGATEADLLRTGEDPLALLVWAAHNRILGPATQLQCAGMDREIPSADLDAVARELVTFESAVRAAEPGPDALLDRPVMERMVVVPGLGLGAAASEVGAVYATSWGEVFYRRWTGSGAVAAFVDALFVRFLREVPAPDRLAVFVPSRRVVRRSGPGRRLERQLPAVARFLGGPASPPGVRRRYVGPAEAGFAVVDRHGPDDIRYREFPDPDGLLRYLSGVGPHPRIETAVDRQAGSLAVLARIFETAGYGRVDVFVLEERDRETLFVVDEVGHLSAFTVSLTPEPYALARLLSFLEDLVPRLAAQPGSPLAGLGFPDAVRIHTLVFEGACRVITATQEHLAEARALGLKPTGLTIEQLPGGTGYRVSWGDQTLESGQVDDPLAEVRRRILAARRRGGSYRVFITRLFLDARFRERWCGPFETTGHHLFYKRALEQRLST